MIRWDLTKQRFGTNISNTRKSDWVVTECDNCHMQAEHQYAQHKQTMKKKGRYYCKDCATKSDEFRKECSERAKCKWKDASYRDNNIISINRKKLSESSRKAWDDDRRKYLSELMKEKWSDSDYRDNMSQVISNNWTDNRRQKQSDDMKEKWSDSDYRDKIRKSAVDQWNDTEYRGKVIDKLCSKNFRESMSVSLKNSDEAKKVREYRRKKFADKFIDISSKTNPNYSYDLVDYHNSKTNVTIICDIHGSFEQSPNSHLYKNNKCPKCAKSYDKLQREIDRFVKSMGYITIFDDKQQISPLELDIFIPSVNFAIEVHGLYWHSYDHRETIKERDKHKYKLDICRSKGIRLIQIFENEWKYNNEIVKSMIINKLGHSQRVYARKCSICKIDSRQHAEFMDQNHIQGSKGCSVAYGLIYDGELVSMMSFNKHPKHQWEITRFANKLDYSIVGGASRLFKRFLSDIDPNQILTYADRRYSDGNLYRKLGFEFIGHTKPNYFYIKGGKIYSRHQFQKHKLNKLRLFNQKLSESQNMFNNGYRRIWDAGHYKFLWQK